MYQSQYNKLHFGNNESRIDDMAEEKLYEAFLVPTLADPMFRPITIEVQLATFLNNTLFIDIRHFLEKM